MITYTTETVFFFSIFIVFLFAVGSLFKPDKKRGVRISRVEDYRPPTGSELNFCKEISKLQKNNIIPATYKNQRQKRKQKHHINKY